VTAGGGTLLDLEGVTRRFVVGPTTVDALRSVTLSIRAGETVALVGPSGSGKTTLMNIVGLLDRPSAGSYRFEGREVSGLGEEDLAGLRNRRIGFVFQTFNLLPRMDALANVALPLVYSGTPRTERHDRAEAALAAVDLKDRMRHRPNELSGGQRQRVAIARALVNQPALLLADEPTGNLDTKVGAEIVRLFQRLNAERGVTVVTVTHDPGVAAQSKRVLRMVDGEIVGDALSAEAQP
jgi:putative ABC transport system ATP-binding protein